MKKRIGTAILSVLCFILMLRPAYAADDRIEVMSAYVMDKELQVFVDVPDLYDPSSFQVFWSDRDSNESFTLNAISGKCAHYLFLSERSKNMENSAETVSAFINAIEEKENLSTDLNHWFFDNNGLESMFSGDAGQIGEKLRKAEYSGADSNPYNAVDQIFDELGRLRVAAGDPVYVFLITSGSFQPEDGERSRKVKSKIDSHHEVIFGTLCTDAWAYTETERIFTTGKGMDFVADSKAAAREKGEEFVTWTSSSLSLLRIPLDDDELALAKEGVLEGRFSFEGGRTYSVGNGEREDIPKQTTINMRNIGVYGGGEDSGEGKAPYNEAGPDNGTVSENGSVSGNESVSGNGTVSENGSVSENETVSDNDAVSGNEADDGKKPGRRSDRGDDDDEDESEGLPGFVLPLAIGGGVLLILIVVVIIVLIKGGKNRTKPGPGVDMPVSYGTDTIMRTEEPARVGSTVAFSSGTHSRPSNVDQAADALLAMTIEVYAGHCVRSSAVIYLHDLISFGSDNICDVLFRDAGVEAEHLRVSYSEGRVIVEDLSVGGVYVNGMRIQSRNPLRSGDVIGMGEAEFALKWSV